MENEPENGAEKPGTPMPRPFDKDAKLASALGKRKREMAAPELDDPALLRDMNRKMQKIVRLASGMRKIAEAGGNPMDAVQSSGMDDIGRPAVAFADTQRPAIFNARAVSLPDAGGGSPETTAPVVGENAVTTAGVVAETAPTDMTGPAITVIDPVSGGTRNDTGSMTAEREAQRNLNPLPAPEVPDQADATRQQAAAGDIAGETAGQARADTAMTQPASAEATTLPPAGIATEDGFVSAQSSRDFDAPATAMAVLAHTSLPDPSPMQRSDIQMSKDTDGMTIDSDSVSDAGSQAQTPQPQRNGNGTGIDPTRTANRTWGDGGRWPNIVLIPDTATQNSNGETAYLTRSQFIERHNRQPSKEEYDNDQVLIKTVKDGLLTKAQYYAVSVKYPDRIRGKTHDEIIQDDFAQMGLSIDGIGKESFARNHLATVVEDINGVHQLFDPKSLNIGTLKQLHQTYGDDSVWVRGEDGILQTAALIDERQGRNTAANLVSAATGQPFDGRRPDAPNAVYRVGSSYVSHDRYEELRTPKEKENGKEAYKSKLTKEMKENKSDREVLLQTPDGSFMSPDRYRHAHPESYFKVMKEEGLDPEKFKRPLAPDATRPSTLVIEDGVLKGGKQIKSQTDKRSLAARYGKENVLTQIDPGPGWKAGSFRDVRTVMKAARTDGNELDVRLSLASAGIMYSKTARLIDLRIKNNAQQVASSDNNTTAYNGKPRNLRNSYGSNENTATKSGTEPATTRKTSQKRAALTELSTNANEGRGGGNYNKRQRGGRSYSR